MTRPPVVLLTDFGLRDEYAGVIQGVILTVFPGARVVNLSHEVPPGDIPRAAYLLNNAYSYFPKGSVFVCVVDPGVGTKRKALAVKKGPYYFIGPDNGIFSLLLEDRRHCEAREIKNRKFFLKRSPSATFHGRDIFSPAGAHLAKGNAHGKFLQLGKKTASPRVLEMFSVKRSKRSLTGSVLFFDHFGNAITSIRKRDLPDSAWKRCRVRIKNRRLGNLVPTYGLAKKKLAALINSFDHLEIAAPNASAQKTGKLKTGDRVTVEF